MEVDLDTYHIFKLAVLVSLCIEFKDVLQIQSIEGFMLVS